MKKLCVSVGKSVVVNTTMLIKQSHDALYSHPSMLFTYNKLGQRSRMPENPSSFMSTLPNTGTESSVQVVKT